MRLRKEVWKKIQLLSHTKTKTKLTIYLGQRIKEYADHSGRQLVVAWGSVCKATHKDTGHLQKTKRKLTQRWSYMPLMLLLMVQLNYRFTLWTQLSLRMDSLQLNLYMMATLRTNLRNWLLNTISLTIVTGRGLMSISVAWHTKTLHASKK